MKVSFNWLKEFVNLPADVSLEEVGARLTMATVEVEGIEHQAEQFTNMVVGEILNLVKHPQADKLQVCQVDIGHNKVIQIICGATNIYEGFKGVVALPGSRVRWHGQGDLVTLEAAKIRGVESFGMICAGSEIGLGSSPETGVLELPKEAIVGELAAKALGFNDQVLEIENKSMNHRPDLWGHLGLAREIAAIYETKFNLPKVNSLKELLKKTGGLTVVVENETDCPRYLGAWIKNVKVEPSPKWLQQRLLAVGSKPINVLVDLTNYVMLETAEPLHAFDAAQLVDRTIVVRRAKKGEDLICLDGQNYSLDDSMLVIADQTKPIALAGIMGGLASAISEHTTEIILEAANFEPVLIRRASLKLNNRTEASSRFEKALDATLPELAMGRLISLLKTIQPQIEIVAIADHFPKAPASVVIDLPIAFAQKRIGHDLSPVTMKNILERLSFGVKEKKGIWQISVPPFRATKDIKEPIDLVEEIARIYGYDNLPPTLPHIDLVLPETNISKLKERQAKTWLSLAAGFTEVYNYLFIGSRQLTALGFNPKEAIEVINPIAPDQNLLRPSLIPSLVKNLYDNLRWQDNLNLFELDRVFINRPGEFSTDQTKKEFLSRQPYHLALAKLVRKDQPEEFFSLKGVVEGLLAELQVSFNWQANQEAPVWADASRCLALVNEQGTLGHLGFLKPEYQGELVLGNKEAFTGVFVELDFQALVKGVSENKQYHSLQKFPAMIQDLVVVAPENVFWADLEETIKKASSLVAAVTLFDVFPWADHKKSLGFRLTLQALDRTLTMEEVEKIKAKLLAILEKEHQAIGR